MSNGNGTIDPLDAAPISKYVRPSVALAGAAVGFALLIMDALYALFSQSPVGAIIGAVAGLAALGLGFAAYYFNVRGQEKSLANATNLGVNIGSQIGSVIKDILVPKVDSGQSTVVADDVSAVEPKPAKVEYVSAGNSVSVIDPKKPAAFDKDAFMADVAQSATRRLAGTGAQLNSAVMYYTARDKLAGLAAPWKFSTKTALVNAYDCLLDLVGKAFTEIWGVDMQTAIANIISNKASGCTTCGTKCTGCHFDSIDAEAHYLDPDGLKYWFILREYREVQQILATLWG